MQQVRRTYNAAAAAGGAAAAAGGAALAKLQQGTYGTSGEIIDKTYYDTLVLLNTATVYRMFTVPEGQGAPPKTKDLTNMVSSSQISQGQNLTVHSISVQYITHAAIATAALLQNIYDFFNHTTCEVVIPGKDNIGDWALAELMGASFLVAAQPAATNFVNQVYPSFNGIRHLKVPIVLSALTTFEFRVTPQVLSAAGINGDFLRVGLRGILKRSS